MSITHAQLQPPFRGLELTRGLGAIVILAAYLGQAVLMGDWRLISYGALLWLFFHAFVVEYEEPTLEQTFGREYEASGAGYCR